MQSLPDKLLHEAMFGMRKNDATILSNINKSPLIKKLFKFAVFTRQALHEAKE